jgi:hypothetical protein
MNRMDTYQEDLVPEGAEVMRASVVPPFNQYQACVVMVGNYYSEEPYVLERASYDAIGWGAESYTPGDSFHFVAPEYDFADMTLGEVLTQVKATADGHLIVEEIIEATRRCIADVREHLGDRTFFEFPPERDADWNIVKEQLARLEAEVDDCT